MRMWQLPWSGGCRCAQVRFTVTEPPVQSFACHCTGCQTMSASAYTLTLMLPAGGFAVTQGKPVIGGLHGDTRHFFCPHCMTWLFTRPAGFDDFVNLRPSALDDHRWFRPFVDVFRSEGLEWAETGAVHRYDGIPDNAEWPALFAAFAADSPRPG